MSRRDQGQFVVLRVRGAEERVAFSLQGSCIRRLSSPAMKRTKLGLSAMFLIANYWMLRGQLMSPLLRTS